MAKFATAGTKLQVSIAAVFTDIPGVEGFDGPTGTKTEIDATPLDATAAEFISGMPDFGTVSWTMYWDPAHAAHQHLLTSYKTANSSDSFKIVCSDSGNAEIAFSGAVTGFAWGFAKNAMSTVQVTVKLSGNVTVTP